MKLKAEIEAKSPKDNSIPADQFNRLYHEKLKRQSILKSKRSGSSKGQLADNTEKYKVMDFDKWEKEKVNIIFTVNKEPTVGAVGNNFSKSRSRIVNLTTWQRYFCSLSFCLCVK